MWTMGFIYNFVTQKYQSLSFEQCATAMILGAATGGWQGIIQENIK